MNITHVKSKKAFSLFELSVVVLIIGLIIAGIAQGSKLVRKSQLSSFRVLTKNSPVKDIPNLIAWYETSLETSFETDEAIDGTAISTWHDQNKQKVTRNDATQGSESAKPQYVDDAFGVLPGIRFASGDAMGLDGTPLAYNGYTVFVVEKRTSNKSENYFLGGTTSGGNKNLIIGYRTNTQLTLAHHSNDLNSSVDGYDEPNTRMHMFIFSTNFGKRIRSWNKSGISSSASTTQRNPLTTYVGAALGRSGNYVGDLAEMIIFNRTLKTKEQEDIKKYLSEKYDLQIN